MLFRIFLTALVAGVIGGAVVTGVQELGTTPLILEAEVYENAVGHPHEGAAAEAGDEEWAPRDGIERLFYTFLGNLVMAAAFALLLASAFTVYGRTVNLRQSVAWGLAGFAAFTFIPSIGLPPEIPGMVAADISARQIWWWSSAIASCVGLGLIAFAPQWLVKIIGAGIILAPFVVGAPHPEHGAEVGSVPPELAAQFATTTLGTALVLWLVLSATVALVFAKIRVAQEQADREPVGA
ncbi:MAG: CbtA family protein [Alphaproteobacteria bacterium]|nr:CbtA family protein [Alphaproteobacteria bacterium]